MTAELLLVLLCVSVAANAVLALFVARSAHLPRRAQPRALCKCGYDIRASIGGVCPECGEPATVPTAGARGVSICSFCSRSNQQTGLQVEGPGDAYICAPCVELCHVIIEQNRAKATGSAF